jgi:hypothetical protein
VVLFVVVAASQLKMAAWPLLVDRGSVVSDGLEVGELPGAVEGWLLGPVDAEVHEPAPAGDRLDPAALRARRGHRPEPQLPGRAGAGVGQLEQRAQGAWFWSVRIWLRVSAS